MHWENKKIFRKYSSYRGNGSRFKSEEYFLKKIKIANSPKFLDVGCACGDVARYLAENTKSYNFDYYGVEYSSSLYSQAVDRYQTHEFYDPLNKGRKLSTTFINNKFDQDFASMYRDNFDILLATGFIQHSEDPNGDIQLFRDVCIEKSKIIFDIKLFQSQPSLLGGDAYCDHDTKIPFNVYNLDDFMKLIDDVFVNCGFEIYGYDSGVHSSVVLPATTLERPKSAHVCIEYGKTVRNVSIIKI